MNIHEYQARELLSKFGVPVPPGVVVETGDAAAKAFEELQSRHGASLCVVKAQVHAGGRGKGGGVKLVRSADEASEAARTILSKPLITPQTSAEGVPVSKLLVAAGVDIAKEYYLGMVVDRKLGKPVMIASAEGGMDIEEVSENNPDAIIKEPINPNTGLLPYQARKVAYQLGFVGQQIRMAGKIMHQLTELFLKTDCSLAEINPLVVTKPTDEHPDGEVLAIDAKLNFDDNAMFRQKEIQTYHDPAEEEASEIQANKYGLSYIKLDGNIGCLVNGAGLAMATMDIIKLHGGEPANFLDVGGGATKERVTAAFKIILSDPNVEGILVNIFGGIMRCDVIAEGVVAAAREVELHVPLVVRLEGTNVELGKKILAESGLPILSGDNLADAAEKVVAAVKEAK